ncbi:MAG TPA: RidA family protein [Actinomycetota bacterium]|nr:RidA family protein [Actinomycetota bacterium]
MKASSPHRMLNPSTLPRPSGFSHAVVPTPGRTIYLGGQIGAAQDGRLAGSTVVEQLDQACSNVIEALLAAGARAEHLVSIQIFVTSLMEYRTSLPAIGEVWQRHFGRHYPAVSLFEVSALFEPGAKVELVCVAVVPA